MRNFKTLLNPKGVAVVGVSSNPQKLGSVIFNNILKNGYEGNVAPVNPKYPRLYGYECYKSVSKIPFQIDLAVIVIPTEYVFDAVKDCAKKKVKNVVIITAGFMEVGEEGTELEIKIAQYAKKHKMNLIGPNCLGVISSKSDLNASFAAQHPIPGNIAFLSQSGAFNTAMLDLVVNKLLGFNYFISLGNKADVDEIDLMSSWYEDTSIDVIGAYLEEFLRGQEFVELTSKNRHKPVILLNSGISEAGKKAAASHTGSMAGSARSIKTALRQAGVIQVDSIENMYSNLMLFSWLPRPKGNRVAVITNAGGPGIIITDILSEAGLELAELSEDTKTKLNDFLPDTASLQNPIDILGDALADRYEEAIETVSNDPNVDVIIALLTPQLVTQIEETAKVIVDFYQRKDYPLVPIFIGEKYVEPGLKRLWENQIPAYQYDEEAIDALKNLVDYSTRIRVKKFVKAPNLRKSKHSDEIKINNSSEPKALPAELSKQITDEVGLDTPIEHIGKTYEEILKYFQRGKFPVVLKATTEDVAHKTEEKMLYLDIFTEKQLELSFNQLRSTIEKVTGNKKPNILIQEQIYANEELIMGITFDQDFGHIILFGKGGIYTEVYNDTSTRLVYANSEELLEMIDETKVSKILNGARGLEKLPTDKVLKTLEGMQEIVLRYPEIRSMDINPAMVTINRCIAVDVKMFI